MNPNNFGFGGQGGQFNMGGMGMGGAGSNGNGFNFDFSRFNNNPFVTGGSAMPNGGGGGWNQNSYGSVVPNPGVTHSPNNGGQGQGQGQQQPQYPVHFQTLDWNKAIGGGANMMMNSPSHRGDAYPAQQQMPQVHVSAPGGGSGMDGGGMQLPSPYNSGNVKLISVTPMGGSGQGQGGMQMQQQQMGGGGGYY